MKYIGVTTSIALSACMLFFPQIALSHGAQERIYPGTMCELRGDALRGDGEFTEPMWKYLGVSQFGFIANTNRTTDIPVICPIERGAIRKGSGITVAVKFNVLRTDNYTGTPNTPPMGDFACTLANVTASGTDSEFSVTKSRALLDELTLPGISRYLTLSLDQTNRAKSFDDTRAGAYVLSCWLPKIYEESGLNVFETRLVHYAVKERD